TDHALLLGTRAHQQDRARALLADRDLAAREDRHAAPRGHLVAAHLGAGGVEPAAVALLAERRDRARMGQEEPRVLPHEREQLVEVVGGGRTAAGVDALLE